MTTPITEASQNPFSTGNSVVISFRIQTSDYHRITEIMEKSPIGYTHVGDYLRHLLRTQAFRLR